MAASAEGSGPSTSDAAQARFTGELARCVGADAVAAVDPSPPFVEAARARNPGVDVRVATAERLPFPGDAFDAALAQLVVHFMSDPVAGLAEMARVTRPGGVVAACVWDYAGGRGPISVFWAAAREIDPGATDESAFARARQGHLVELLEAAGLRDVDETVIGGPIEHASFDEWWEPFTYKVGPAGIYLASLDPDSRDALRERCRGRLPGEPLVVNAEAWAARGVV